MQYRFCIWAAGRLSVSASELLNREGMVTEVDLRFLQDESGAEFLIKPAQSGSVLEDRFSPPAPGIISEVRLLARSGSARFVVTSEPPELSHEILPHLPLILLDSSWRSIYLHAQDQNAADEAFSLAMPADSEEWRREMETLRAFHFDERRLLPRDRPMLSTIKKMLDEVREVGTHGHDP